MRLELGCAAPGCIVHTLRREADAGCSDFFCVRVGQAALRKGRGSVANLVSGSQRQIRRVTLSEIWPVYGQTQSMDLQFATSDVSNEIRGTHIGFEGGGPFATSTGRQELLRAATANESRSDAEMASAALDG